MIETTIRQIGLNLEKEVGRNTNFYRAFCSLEKRAKTTEELVVLAVMKESCQEMLQKLPQRETSPYQRQISRVVNM